MSVSVWVLGEALMDCVAQDDGSLQALIGGSPFNLACAVALQGVDVGYLNPFSNDVFGHALANRLAHTGAKALGKTSRKPTSLAVVNLQAGQPSYGFYREGIADRDYLAEDIVTQLKNHPPGVLHTGSLMAMPPEHRKVMHVIQFAKALGWTISIDVNLRTKVADDLPGYLQAVNDMAALADWLKASDEDLQVLGWAAPTLAEAPGLVQALRRQWAPRARHIALTFGAQGAYLHVGESGIAMAAPRIAVVDTVGAGDTFWGNCVADWAMQPQAPLPTTLRLAMHAAAINCGRSGCQPPTLQETLAFVATPAAP